jgi:uncharacterized damage-inducible protein DinB
MSDRWMLEIRKAQVREEKEMLSELDSYLQRIEDLRGQVGTLIAGLPAEALNWRPIEGESNSLAVLATHVAGAEHFWMAEVVGGYPATRDRDAEFATQVDEAAELVRLLEKVGAETRQVFSVLTEADPSSPSGQSLDGAREARGRTVPVRWCILHVIDHTALHLGHMQLTYQLWAGGEGKPSPFWFERLGARD